MKKNIILKSISLVVAVTFLSHNLTYGLGIQPCSLDSVKQAKVLTMAQKLLYADRGNNPIVQNIISFPFSKGFEGGQFLTDKGEVDIRKAPYNADFDVKVNYNNLPAGWDNNPILEKTDLIEAIKCFAFNEAHIPASRLVILEEYFSFEENTLPIDVILKGEGEQQVYIIMIHPEFKKQWEQLRKNDIWFKTNIGEGTDSQRTVSVAWGVFYRAVKHIMGDLEGKAYEKGQFTLKGGAGHLWFDGKSVQEVGEDEANKINGRYGVINEGIWAWFLNVNYGEAARRSNTFFRNRLEGMLDENDPAFKELELYKEFSSLVKDKTKRKAVIAFAYAINYEAYRNNIKLEPIKSDPVKNEQYLKNLKESGYKELFRGTGIDKSVKAGNADDSAKKIIAWSTYVRTVIKKQGFFTIEDYHEGYNQVKGRFGFADLPQKRPDFQLQKDLDALVKEGFLVSALGNPVKYSLTIQSIQLETFLVEEINGSMIDEFKKVFPNEDSERERITRWWKAIFWCNSHYVSSVRKVISEYRVAARKDLTNYVFMGTSLLTAGEAFLFYWYNMSVVLIGLGLAGLGGIIFRAAFKAQKDAVHLGILSRQYERVIESFAGPASAPQIVETEQIKELMNKYAQTGILSDKNTKEKNRIISVWKAFAEKYGEEKKFSTTFTISDFKQELDKEIELNQSQVNRSVSISAITFTGASLVLLYGVMNNVLSVVPLAMAAAVFAVLLWSFVGGPEEEGKALGILAYYLANINEEKLSEKTDNRFNPGRRSEDAEKIMTESMYIIIKLQKEGYFTLNDYRIGCGQVKDRLVLAEVLEKSPDSQLQKDLDVLVERGDLVSEESPGKNTRYKIAGKVKTMLAEELNRAMIEELKAGKEASRKQERFRKLWEDIVRPYFHREPFAFGRRFVFMGGTVNVNEISLKISENRSKARKDVTRGICAGATLVTAGTAVLFSWQSLPVILVGLGMGWVGGVIFRAAFKEQKNVVELGILFRLYERVIESFAGPASAPQIVETEQIKELMNKYAQTGILSDKNTKEKNRIISVWKAFAGKYGEEKDTFTISDFKQEMDKEIELNQSKVDRKVNLSAIAITSEVTMLLYGVMHNNLAVVIVAMAPAVLGVLLLVFLGGSKKEGKALSILTNHLATINEEKLAEKTDKRFKPGRRPEDARIVIRTSTILQEIIKEKRYFTISDYRDGFNEVKQQYGFAELPERENDSQSGRDLNTLVLRGYLVSAKESGKATKYFVITRDWEGNSVTSAEEIESGIPVDDVDAAVISVIDKTQEINEIEKTEFKDSWKGFFGAPREGHIVNLTQLEKKLNKKVKREKTNAWIRWTTGCALMISGVVIAAQMKGLNIAPIMKAVPALMVAIGLISYLISMKNSYFAKVLTKLTAYFSQAKEQLESSGSRVKPGRSPEDVISVICKSGILTTALRMKGYFTIKDYHSGYNEVREQLQFAPLSQKRPSSQTRRDLEALVEKRVLQVEKKIGSASKYSFPRKQRKEDIGVGTPMENIDEVVKKAIENNVNNDEKAQKKIVKLWEKFLEEPTEGPVDDIKKLTESLEDKSIKTKQHAVLGVRTGIAISVIGGLISVFAIPNVWTIGGCVVVSGGLVVLIMSMRRFIIGGRFAELGAYLEEASVVLEKEGLLVTKNDSMVVPEEESKEAAETADVLDEKLNGPSDGVVPGAGPANGRPEETVIEEISRYIIKVRQENPDAIKDLSGKELKSIWESVNLLHSTDIQIFIPQPEILKPTPAINRTIIAIQKRGVPLETTRFSVYDEKKIFDEKKIKAFLKALKDETKKETKKIIIMDPETRKVLAHYLNNAKNQEAVKAFKNVRVLPIALPGEEMENDKKTSFQAHVLRTAILARMLEKGSHFLDIKSQLSTLLEDSFISLDASSSKPCTDFEEFVKQLIRTDDVGCKDHPSKILARMQFFLTGKWTINLVKKLEMELHALKTFWVAA